MGKKYFYVLKNNAAAVLREISTAQATNKTFYNVRVLPYRGKKLDPASYVTIVIG